MYFFKGFYIFKCKILFDYRNPNNTDPRETIEGRLVIRKEGIWDVDVGITTVGMLLIVLYTL
jgi:hypothetical protein